VSGRLILISGIGSAIGPLLGSVAMSALGIRGLFHFMAAVTALFALFALARALSASRPPRKRLWRIRLLPTIFTHDLAYASQEPPQSWKAG